MFSSTGRTGIKIKLQIKRWGGGGGGGGFPSLISLMVSVDVKHDVYLLTQEGEKTASFILY